MKDKKTIAAKALTLAGDVLMYLIIAIAMFVLMITIMSKRDREGVATVFGYQLRFVQSDSMEQCDLTDVSEFEIQSIPVKSCVFVETVPESEAEKAEWYKSLKVGDVLTFKYFYSKQETITHRIVDIDEKPSGGYVITLEGDNKRAETNLLQQTIDTSLEDSPNYIIGKVTGQSYFLGVLVYAFKRPIGIVCLIIIPCLIIIAFEIIRLVRVFGKDKKEKLRAEKKKQDAEIEELKRQLALLQKKNETDPKEARTAPAEEPKKDVSQQGTTDTMVIEANPKNETSET